MAAALMQPSPRSMMSKTHARVPLASNPNAANSPFRGFVPGSGKRARAVVEASKELVHEQPPSKRQAMHAGELENVDPRSYLRQSQNPKDAEGRLFTRRSATVTSFEEKLLAAKQSKMGPPQESRANLSPDGKRSADTLDSVRQWQRHYRKQFPTFVFYFDGLPKETEQRLTRAIHDLGSRETKFFSKDVTHLITTRAAGTTSTARDDGELVSGPRGQHQARTIDPSLLNAHAGSVQRTANLLDASTQSRGLKAFSSQVVDSRKVIAKNDLVHTAKGLGIKIWALEKFERMMDTMFNQETGEQASHLLTRSHATADLAQKHNQADLQRMIRHEKASGQAARETNPVSEWTSFRGYYIYVHDMNEVLRPVMVRDYSRPASKELGKWPQFRQSSAGRCPFVEDPSYARRMAEEERQAAVVARSRTRSANVAADANGTVLVERHANQRESPRKHAVAKQTAQKPLDPPKLPLSRQGSAEGMPPLFTSTQAKMRAQTRYIGGEPVASGVQPSNVTSAIRSQIISSTAISSTAPGGRIGASKEMHALKRKVLERGTNVTSGQTLGSSYMNDVRAALNGDNKTRSTKRKAQEALGDIREDTEDERPRKIHHTRAVQKKTVQRTPRPGYCENCRDKYDDFDEHILSRKHRKFALTPSNWTQLDQLLGQLKRPLKQPSHGRGGARASNPSGDMPQRRDSRSAY